MKNLILESAITFLVVIDPLALAAFFVAFVGKIKVETKMYSSYVKLSQDSIYEVFRTI